MTLARGDLELVEERSQAIPSPPPRSSSRGSQPRRSRASAANSAIQPTARRAASSSRSCEPMWTCSPASCGSSASAGAGGTPNFEPVCPVRIDRWVARDAQQPPAHTRRPSPIDLLERVDDQQGVLDVESPRAPRRICCCRARRSRARRRGPPVRGRSSPSVRTLPHRVLLREQPQQRNMRGTLCAPKQASTGCGGRSRGWGGAGGRGVSSS